MTREEQVLSFLETRAGRKVLLRDIAAVIDSDLRAAKSVLGSIRRYGYGLEWSQTLGYRLTVGPNALSPWLIRKFLETSFVGREILVHYFEIESTQKEAIMLGESRGVQANGAVVIARQQIAGRGRMSRKWLSPKGGVWMSIVLKPEMPPADCALLPFVGSLAALSAIANRGNLAPWLKWPNDVLVGRKKVAGVLGDMGVEKDKVGWAALGIGINANLSSRNLQDIARRIGSSDITSLRQELGEEVNLAKLAASVLNYFEYYYELLSKAGAAEIIRRWKEKSPMLGRTVTITRNGKSVKGKAVSVLDDGQLVVQAGKSRCAFSSGDVKLSLENKAFMR